MDPLAEEYYPISPFAYVANNPVLFIDPNGKEIVISYRENEDSEVINVRYTDDGKLYHLKTGKEYQGNNEYILGVQTTLNNLKNLDGRSEAVVTDLVEGSEKHTIANFDSRWDGTESEIEGSYNIRSRTSGNPKGSLTKYVPRVDRNKLFRVSDKESHQISDEEILGHELKHAYNRKHNMQDFGYSNIGIVYEEIDGVNFQNVIRAAQGRGPKTTFAGRDISKYLIPPYIYNNLR